VSLVLIVLLLLLLRPSKSAGQSQQQKEAVARLGTPAVMARKHVHPPGQSRRNFLEKKLTLAGFGIDC
jgi:hypothetical protein